MSSGTLVIPLAPCNPLHGKKHSSKRKIHHLLNENLCLLILSSATAFTLCLRSSSTWVTLCLHEGKAVIDLKREKEKIHKASRRNTSWHPHPYSCGPHIFDILHFWISLSPHPPITQPSLSSQGL